MLPCGRYYYEPEGGYVGNPWVKFSYQYIYLYLAWFVHHLDLIDHYMFQFFQTFIRKSSNLYKNKSLNDSRLFNSKYILFTPFKHRRLPIFLESKIYDIDLKGVSK